MRNEIKNKLEKVEKMLSQKVDFTAVVQEVLDIIHGHGLTPNTLGLIFNVPREEFEALAQQYPGHHPRIIIIKKKNDWFVQVQPILKPGDYPTGEILKLSTE